MNRWTHRALGLAQAVITVTVITLGATACGDDADPPSYLKDLRVLAVASDPLEVVASDALTQPGATAVTVSAFVHVPPGTQVVSERWRFCAVSAGPYSGYECLYPADCEVELTDQAVRPASGAFSQVSADPVALGARCTARLAQEDGLPQGGGSSVEPGEQPDDLVVDVWFRYEVETEDGQRRDAVLALPVWIIGSPDVENGAPGVSGVEWAGAPVRPGDTVAAVTEDDEVELRVVVDGATVDRYVDAAGRDREEEIITSFYATAGRFDLEREVGTDVTVAWEASELAEGETVAQIFAVLRDLRGGQTVWGPFSVPIQRKPPGAP